MVLFSLLRCMLSMKIHKYCHQVPPQAPGLSQELTARISRLYHRAQQIPPPHNQRKTHSYR